MLRAFSSAVAGMRSQMAHMDVVANNIANVNTTAFKASRARFSDMLYQTLSAGAGAGDTSGSINPNQIGLGTRLAGVDTAMTQGALRATGNPLDLAIEGEGFFMLKDNAGAVMYTRDGSFGLDAQGRLVNPSNGMLVQSADGSDLPAIDLKQFASFSITPDGKVIGALSDGSGTEEIGQIGVATFPNPAGLLKVGDNLWKVSAASGAVTTGPGADPEIGSGGIRAGVLEGANVDLAQEFSNMIIAQRAFQANSRVISTSDELLQDLVNIKR